MAPDGSIAVRIVRDPFCKALLEKFRKPIVSTSANFSGEPAPALFTDIEPRLLAMVDYVVTWRQNDLTPGKPSSIIRRAPEVKLASSALDFLNYWYKTRIHISNPNAAIVPDKNFLCVSFP
jgi:tRNA A37 threonylcarbamoyladenosine synthetase subunit TsaC/SUA5/YrdC